MSARKSITFCVAIGGSATYVFMPPKSSMRPTGVPVCFRPEKQQAVGAEASVGDIVKTRICQWWRGDNPVVLYYL
jgi:hypothetical protein